jgi:hypothetical protein
MFRTVHETLFTVMESRGMNWECSMHVGNGKFIQLLVRKPKENRTFGSIFIMFIPL